MSILAFEKDLIAACHTAATCYQRHHFYCIPEQALQWREDEKSKWWFCTFQPCVNSQTARSEYKGNPPKNCKEWVDEPCLFPRGNLPCRGLYHAFDKERGCDVYRNKDTDTWTDCDWIICKHRYEDYDSFTKEELIRYKEAEESDVTLVTNKFREGLIPQSKVRETLIKKGRKKPEDFDELPAISHEAFVETLSLTSAAQSPTVLTPPPTIQQLPVE